ncbi:MAG: ABC transporter substrate-binding protein [Planctomycetota bacterium]
MKLLGVLLALGMIAAACGDSDDDSDDGGESTEADAGAEGGDEEGGGGETATPDPDADLSGTSVNILGPEAEDEGEAILRTLREFAEPLGIEVSYTGANDAADQVNALIAGGNPPDIFVFPQPGKLADFARSGDVFALPENVDAASAAVWSDAWRSFGEVDGAQYGIPTKADLKSLVWYKPALWEEKGYEIPESWDEFKALADTMIANGDTPLCVGIESGPATGWVFTDWVEDLMLRFHGADVYDQWVANEIPFNDPAVLQVWNEVLDLWNTEGMVFAASGSIAATAIADNAQPLLDESCMMHRQASFYPAFFPEGTGFADGSADAVDVFYFPSVSGDRPVLGAGTLMGALRDAPEVWAIMEYAAGSAYAETRQQIQTDLKEGGLSGFLSAAEGQDISVYQPLEQSFLDILATADVVRFDASDLMPSAVGAGTFWTEGTAAVNGDTSAEDAAQAIQDSWPS